jgi:uncharacterized membrane protein
MNVRELAARITNVACYIAVVWLALRLATKGRALLFAVALLPSSLALASGLHPDALGIAIAILAVALVLRLREQPSRVLLTALAVDLVVVAVCKNLYSPLVLLLLLVPAAAFASKRQRWAYVAGTAAVGLLTTVLWLSQVSKIHYRLDMLNIDSKASTTWITHHPFGFLHQVWNGLWDPFIRHVTLPGLVEVLGGLRPSRTTQLAGDLVPLPVALLAIAVLVVAVHADPGPAGVRRSRDRLPVLAVTLTCAVGCVLLIFFGLALTANAAGASTITSVQGRYLLPVIPLAAFAAGRRVQTAAVPWVVPAGTLFFLLWVTARFFVVFY